MNRLPQYCCAIIYQQTNVIIMEQRPADAVYAAGRLCCFGGTRESTEDPLQCIQRELHEELHWCAPDLQLAHKLFRGESCVAWFYHCTLDTAIENLHCESGRSIVSVDLNKRKDFPISDWHSQVLNNYLSNIDRSDLLDVS